jgi:hypothetical protein
MARQANVVQSAAHQAAAQARVQSHVQAQQLHAQAADPYAVPRGGAEMPGIMSNSLEDFDAQMGVSAPMQATSFSGPLELISIAPKAGPVAAVKGDEQAAPVEGALSTRQRAMKELSGYGDEPKGLIQCVPYFIRVMLRKRVLEDELAGLVTQRKRLDAQADDALCAFAEAIYERRNDERCKNLNQQFRVVAEAREQVGAKEAAGQQANAQHKQEMGRLTRELAKIELLVQPLRKRETELQAREDALRAQIKRREGLVKKAQGELQKIRESKELSAGDRIAVLEADIEAANGEIQSCNVQLLPLQEDLGVLRRDIAKHMGTIAALREEEAGVTRAMDREQERHRVSTGGAKSAYREALRSLATAAQRGKVAELCAAQHKAVVDATERARKKLEAEELQRAANNGYDVAAYKRGMFLIVGTTTLLFVVMLAKIIF